MAAKQTSSETQAVQYNIIRETESCLHLWYASLLLHVERVEGQPDAFRLPANTYEGLCKTVTDEARRKNIPGKILHLRIGATCPIPKPVKVADDFELQRAVDAVFAVTRRQPSALLCVTAVTTTKGLSSNSPKFTYAGPAVHESAADVASTISAAKAGPIPEPTTDACETDSRTLVPTTMHARSAPPQVHATARAHGPSGGPFSPHDRDHPADD